MQKNTSKRASKGKKKMIIGIELYGKVLEIQIKVRYVTVLKNRNISI